MIELNEEQRLELSAQEPRAVDPATKKTDVLVSEDVYQRIKGILFDAGDWSDESLRAQLARSFQGNRGKTQLEQSSSDCKLVAA